VGQLSNSESEVKRLEDLWLGEFGNAYIDRNISAGNGREPFWNMVISKYPIKRILEVGCNVGANLQWICKVIPPREVYGVDINETAIKRLASSLPGINTIRSPARELPFRDRWFDLVFTAGVLIHQPEAALPLVMSEIVRCSRRYVLCVEYFSEETIEIPYRGQVGALFKRNYGQIYREIFPELKLLEQGTLNREEGWDDVTFWLLENTR
jgi:pseudaminic acid biosynthesis-associated methylase